MLCSYQLFGFRFGGGCVDGKRQILTQPRLLRLTTLTQSVKAQHSPDLTPWVIIILENVKVIIRRDIILLNEDALPNAASCPDVPQQSNELGCF